MKIYESYPNVTNWANIRTIPKKVVVELFFNPAPVFSDVTGRVLRYHRCRHGPRRPKSLSNQSSITRSVWDPAAGTGAWRTHQGSLNFQPASQRIYIAHWPRRGGITQGRNSTWRSAADAIKMRNTRTGLNWRKKTIVCVCSEHQLAHTCCS